MNYFTTLITSVCLLKCGFVNSLSSLENHITNSSSAGNVPAALTPCGNAPSCTLFPIESGITIYAYADYPVSQTVASVTYDITTYRDTVITNTITAFPQTPPSFDSLPGTIHICDSLACLDASPQYNYQTTAVVNGMTITSGHVYVSYQNLFILNTGYETYNGQETRCATDLKAQATELFPYFTSLIDLGTSVVSAQWLQLPTQLISEIREDPLYTISYPEILTCAFGMANGKGPDNINPTGPEYQVHVTQLTTTTTKVQSIDLDYNDASPAPSAQAITVAVTNLNPTSKPLPTPAPAPAGPISPANYQPSNSPSAAFVPTTITNPAGSPIVSSALVLYSPTTSTNAAGIPMVFSVPIHDPNAINTLIYIPITTTNAAGTPTTTSSAIQAVIVSGTTYLAPTGPSPGSPANPTAAPGSPGGPMSIITFSGPGFPSVMTLGTSVITADSSSRFVIGGQTLTPGGVITVASSVISMATGIATGSGSGSWNRQASVIISVFGGPTATGSGTGIGGTRPSIVVANDGMRKGFEVEVIIKLVIVGVIVMWS